MKKLILLATASAWLTFHVKAQDIIILTDLQELEAKVEEISNNSVKYRKWENLDGPVYTISRETVRMIIYENGIRERFPEPVHELPDAIESVDTLVEVDEQDPGVHYPSSSETSTYPDYSYMDRVDYAPYRINMGSYPFGIGGEVELSIIPNLFNFGIGYMYQFPDDDAILSSSYVDLYGGFYAPVNFLRRDYKNKDIGFFPFVHLGYGVTEYVTIDGFSAETTSHYADGFIWKVGADYFITTAVGVSVQCHKMEDFLVGIAVSF